MRDASIVIGLGGIGSDVCAKAEAMIPANAPDRDRVRFVAIDTDINSLRDLRRNGFRGITIQISSNISVGLCVENQRAEIEGWYPNNPMLDKKPMTEGAGQMRAISRLALHTAVREGRLAPLYRLIDELRQMSKEPAVQAIRIYIVSSLSGGTGSGIFLPLAMYLERYVKNLFGDFDSICKGFFMLPSTMKDLTDTFLEKRSLDANSYAAVKELSAFLAQGDQWNIRPKFTMELAREGELATDSYSSAGYEYCYLFGKVNRKKLLKSSFEEIKNTVANAVYMQVCSPIRGINNSREDNMPKFLTEQAQKLRRKNLRRFGAVGCGELVYPYQLLKEYYAMRWAIDTMSNTWRQYDRIYFEKEKEYREGRKRGQRMEEVNRAEEYINAIKLADRNDILAEEIRNLCATEEGMSWDIYLNQVTGKVEEIIGQVRNEIEEDKEKIDTVDRWRMDILSKNNDKKTKLEKSVKIRDCFEELRQYMERYVAGNGKYVAEQILAYYPDAEHKPYEMAYWLKRDGNFIHPNAVRYFLYNLFEAIDARKARAEEKKEEAQIDINALDKYKGKFFAKRMRERDIPEFLAKIEKGKEAVYKVSCRSLEISCLFFLKNYVGGLIKAYEEFYEGYGDILRSFGREADTIVHELERQSGISSFYVCADAKCREVVFGQMKEKREYFGANGTLSAFIFQLLQEPLKGDDIKNIQSQVRQYWVDSMGDEFDDLLDINILKAMKREEECRTGHQLTVEDMRCTIEDARKLLETPLVRYISREETKEISFCCYNTELEEERGIYQDIVEWLKGQQGIADPYYYSKYQLIFYCSIVGLEAYDILEFYHGRSNSLIDPGEAFLHYEDTVQSIVLDEGDKPVLTPHIDQNWYSFLELSDPHEEYQYKRELAISGMFLYARLSGLLKGDEEKGYHYVNEVAGKEEVRKLLLAHQYLYRCPALLMDLHQKFNQRLKQDVEECKSVQSCTIFQRLDGKCVYEILIEYARPLTKKEFTSANIGTLISSVEWLVSACVYRFNGIVSDDVVSEKMENIKQGIPKNPPEDGMAREMDQKIRDFYKEREHKKDRRQYVYDYFIEDKKY